MVDSSYIIAPDDAVLVTGSNGFIGSKVVETLLAYGFTNVRCFVRPSSNRAVLKSVLQRFDGKQNAEIVAGDLLSREDCRRAAEGVSVISHLAAGMEKSFAGAFMNSALATRNLVEAFIEGGEPKRFVNVSSFAVYSTLKIGRGALLDETCPLEDSPQERFDAYGFGKLKQEELVREYGRQYHLPFVIVRPGAVFGPGKRDVSGRVGIDTFGFFIHLGGSNRLPLTFVDNCADAIVLAGLKAGVDGEVFNVVDDETLTSSQFFAAYKKKRKLRFSVSFPYFLANGLSKLWEGYSKQSKGQLPPAFNHRRCAAEWGGNQYSNQKLHQMLGWQPRVNMEAAMAAFLGQFEPDHSRSSLV